MTHADTVAALRRHILEEPDDDGLRLILADALADAGEMAQAEFVRASIAYGRGGDWYAMSRAWDAARAYHVIASRPASVRLEGDDEPTGFNNDCFGFRRGMAEVWAVADVPTFEAQAAEVFARHPIRRVVLRSGVLFCNIVNLGGEVDPLNECAMPAALFRLLDGGFYSPETEMQYERRSYASLALALADQEAACAKYGRILAKLPAL